MRGKWFLLVALVLALACARALPGEAKGPNPTALQKIIEAKERHADQVLATPGLLGIAVAADRILILAKDEKAAAKAPRSLDGVPVSTAVTGDIVALAGGDPRGRFARPVPIGVSTGNEGECSAGTISARITDGVNVYALSNNHVYALENNAPLGSNVLQPGRYDTSCAVDPADVIGTLHDYEPLKFKGNARNYIDAAIALTSRAMVGNATPDDGYGEPSTTPVPAVLGDGVQKYGRTTRLTKGTITGVNASIRVGYSSGTARFDDQIIVQTASAFLLPGDSGSLLVSDPGANPVGLLFAANSSGTLAVANRIDLVLERFGAAIDGGPVTDLAVTGVSGPASVLPDDTAGVDVTVENVGSVDVGADIHVTLRDETDGVDIGTQTISGGLPAGQGAVLNFLWDTTAASLGDHLLSASQDVADDNAANDAAQTSILVGSPPVGVNVTAIAPDALAAGSTVPAEITGSGFEPGAGVSFVNGSGPAPTASDVIVVDAQHITLMVQVKSGGPRRARTWDVMVQCPDGTSGVLPAGLTVTP